MNWTEAHLLGDLEVMTDAKHTPGPWRVIIDDDGNPLSGRPSVCASDELDCMIVHWDGFVQQYWRSARGDKEIHANARLIAAAPDMLAALERLEYWFDTDAEILDAMTPAVLADHTYQHNMIRAAIAKAKRETK